MPRCAQRRATGRVQFQKQPQFPRKTVPPYMCILKQATAKFSCPRTGDQPVIRDQLTEPDPLADRTVRNVPQFGDGVFRSNMFRHDSTPYVPVMCCFIVKPIAKHSLSRLGVCAAENSRGKFSTRTLKWPEIISILGIRKPNPGSISITLSPFPHLLPSKAFCGAHS